MLDRRPIDVQCVNHGLTRSNQFKIESRRWWFICPLLTNGSACNRRVGRLYRRADSSVVGSATI